MCAACLVGVLAAPATAATPPTFEPGACPKTPIAIPALKTAHCGLLVVPENRTKANGRTIELAVAIVAAASRTPAPDPIVHLTGGPGGIAILEAQRLVDAGLNRDRDLILMDQRGTLYSNPAITCPEIDRFNARALGLVSDTASTRRLHVAATRACLRRLAAKGIDLAAYNTTENAADFADLRTTLGIAQWKVFGVSYGTDLALTLMRQHPEGIRSVTLDSVVPPNLVSIANFWPQARDGFNDLFRACAAQRRCRAQHPGLAGVFTGLVRRLESRPITTKVAAAPGGPSVNVVLDGGALVNWLAAVAFQTPTYRNVPRWIGELAAGRPRSIGVSRIGEVTPSGFTGYGLTYGVSCSEWVPYERASGILSAGRRAFPRYPATVLAQAPQFAYITDDCRVWNVPKASTAQRTVTRSTIPTVILGGTFDAVTSVASGR